MLLIECVRYRVGVWRLGCNPPFGRKTHGHSGGLAGETGSGERCGCLPRVMRDESADVACADRPRPKDLLPRARRPPVLALSRVTRIGEVFHGFAAGAGRANHRIGLPGNYSRRLNPGTPGPITRAMQRGSSRLGRAPAGWPGCPAMAAGTRVLDLKRREQHRWRPWRRPRRAPRTPMVRWLESGVIPMLIDCSRAPDEDVSVGSRGPRALGRSGCLASRPRVL
jgi:hypothetical protein